MKFFLRIGLVGLVILSGLGFGVIGQALAQACQTDTDCPSGGTCINGTCGISTGNVSGGTGSGVAGGETISLENPISFSSLGDLYGSIVTFVLSLVGAVAVIILIISGIMWITAAGNEERITSAKRMATAAVIGLIVVLASYAIISLVTSFLS